MTAKQSDSGACGSPRPLDLRTRRTVAVRTATPDPRWSPVRSRRNAVSRSAGTKNSWTWFTQRRCGGGRKPWSATGGLHSCERAAVVPDRRRCSACSTPYVTPIVVAVPW